MRSLSDLVRTPEGRSFLEERGVQLAREPFLARLSPPASDGLAEMLDLRRALVYSAHQLQCDYAPSVTAKLRALRDAARDGRAAPVAVWLDMDRIGSNKLSSSIVWPRGGKTVRLVPQRSKEMEPRFAPVERHRLEEAVEELGALARSAVGDATAERHRRLAEAILLGGPSTLAEVNLRITLLLVREQVGLDASSVLVSDVAARGLLAPPIDAALADLPGFVAVFNSAVDALLAADVDPQVRHLDDEYLPLRYSCPNDGSRCTLRHERRGPDHVAGATCRSCGTEYRFHLGTSTLSGAEVMATGRWSPDVTLPVLLNDLVSGVIAGRSSGLYGLILNEVAAKVLGGTPVPMLVPEDLASVLAEEAPGSLVHDYLTAA
jgi:hypothetical protein